MIRGDKLWVREDGSTEWKAATYEFRIVNGEPLGKHSVMLRSGGGRRVVCGCQTSEVRPPAVGEKWRDKAGESGAVTLTEVTATKVRFAPHPDECWLQKEYEFPRDTFLFDFEPASAGEERGE